MAQISATYRVPVSTVHRWLSSRSRWKSRSRGTRRRDKTERMLLRAKEMRDAGSTYEEIAAALGVTRQYVWKLISKCQ